MMVQNALEGWDLRNMDFLFVENNCTAENHYVSIGKETYFISWDGLLMPRC